MKLPHLRWTIAALLFCATVINYVDRQALSVMAPVLTRELHLSAIQYANILQCFLLAYTAMYVVSGILVDRWGTRVSLGIFMLWWSISNMLHAFATSAWSLGAFRVLLGIGEPGNFMAASRATSEWFPPKERALMNGVTNAGAAIGAVIAVPMVTAIWATYGWRAAFVLTGAMGLVWLALWWWIYRLPARHPWITPEELRLITADAASTPRERVRWIDLLRLRKTWALFGARFLSDPVWWFYLLWLPKYLVEQRGFTMLQMGALAWVPYLAADAGSVFGGVVSGYFVKRGWSAPRARSAGMWPFALMMPLSLVIAFTDSATVAFVTICVMTFAHMAWKTNLMTLTNDLYPAHVVGSVAGIAALGNGIGGVLFMFLTGQIVHHFSYSSIFVVMGFLHPLSYVLFRALVRPLK